MEFAPELGRHRVFQVSGQDKDDSDGDTIAFTARGRTLSSRGRSFDALTRDWWSGWRFRSTNISEEYTLEQLLSDRGEDIDFLLLQRGDGSLDFVQPGQQSRIDKGTLLSFCPVKDKPEKKRGEGARTGGLSGPAAPLPK